jgi:hypothetical protein
MFENICMHAIMLFIHAIIELCEVHMHVKCFNMYMQFCNICNLYHSEAFAISITSLLSSVKGNSGVRCRIQTAPKLFPNVIEQDTSPYQLTCISPPRSVCCNPGLQPWISSGLVDSILNQLTLAYTRPIYASVSTYICKIPLYKRLCIHDVTFKPIQVVRANIILISYIVHVRT